MFVGIGWITVPIAVMTYMRINKQRAEVNREALERGEKNKFTPQEVREMGDKAPEFRYTI